MKSQGLATNGGVFVMALVTDTEAALKKETDEDDPVSIAQRDGMTTTRKDVCSPHRRQVEDNTTTHGYKPSNRKPASIIQKEDFQQKNSLPRIHLLFSSSILH